MGQIVGHKKTLQKLEYMLEAGRVPNSLLFVGAAGQGKKSVAFAVAQSLLCERTPQACGSCPSCLRVSKRQSESVIFLEPEKGVIKIEAARAVVRQLSLAQWAQARVVIIDEAHLLNPQAANALLKSIEEPPEKTHFILLTSSQESVLRTLRSRSQIVRFKTLSRRELQSLGLDTVDLEMQGLAFDIWREILEQRSTQAVQLVKDKVEDRDMGLRVLRMWLEFARDQWFLQHGVEPLMHENLKSEWANVKWAGAREPYLAKMSQMILLTEKDLVGNCDMQLTFENFVLQAEMI